MERNQSNRASYIIALWAAGVAVGVATGHQQIESYQAHAATAQQLINQRTQVRQGLSYAIGPITNLQSRKPGEPLTDADKLDIILEHRAQQLSEQVDAHRSQARLAVVRGSGAGVLALLSIYGGGRSVFLWRRRKDNPPSGRPQLT